MGGSKGLPPPRAAVAAIDLLPAMPESVTGLTIRDAIVEPRTAALLAFYEGLPRQAGLPDRAAAGPERFRPWLGNLMILDPVDGGSDFQYRVYGSEIARYAGFDMTGQRVSDFASRTGVFFLGAYAACLASGGPMLTHNDAEHAAAIVRWERLLLPFRRGADLLQIVASNYPLRYPPPA